MNSNNNFNLDEDKMNNIKNMIDNGNISGAISQISPDMIQNFSKMLQNNSNNQNSNVVENQNDTKNTETTNNTYNKNNNDNSSNNGFDFNNLDPNTIMKITSVIRRNE